MFRTSQLTAIFIAFANLLMAEDKPFGTVVLDETAYWRFYIVPGQDRISAQALKERDPAVVSDGLLKRLEIQTRKRVKDKDWTKIDWMTEARYMIAQNQPAGWGMDGATGPVQFEMDFDLPPPPAGWMKAEFDDSGWPRQRLPFLMGPPPALTYEFAQPPTFGWQRACYRTRFLVDDPAAVKELTLKLTYRGGARVFVNGKEVARGNLPAGELEDNVPADDYPQAAYLAEPDEVSGKGIRVIGELNGGFLDGVDPKKVPEFRGAGNSGRGGAVSRKGWNRLTSLRNRALTPVSVPASLLRKGINVLAIETRASRLQPVVISAQAENVWYHTGVIGVQLLAPSPAVHASMQRPAGVQVWVEDACRRLLSAEFLEEGARADRVRLAGTRNGTYAAQVVVGTDRQLSGLTATAGILKAGDGTVIPDSAIRVQYLVPHSLREIGILGSGRNLGGGGGYSLCEPVDLAFMRHAKYSGKPTEIQVQERLDKAAQLSFFDHIVPQPPETVPAGTCQPIWFSVRIPADAQPGTYQGTLNMKAQGMPPVDVPVEVEVCGWRLPDPRDFTVMMGLEQSPYGVAKQYKVPLWSDRHFELMETSFRELARIGNTWLMVPVILDSEFGNIGEYRTPPMIQWIRKKDGSIAFDYAVMDRYLDLAVKHWGRPKCICFGIMQVGTGRVNMGMAKVLILDEVSGKTDEVNLVTSNPEYEKLWTAFAVALHRHMREKGLEKVMYWGHSWDDVDDPNLIRLLARHVPEVGWASGGHSITVGAYPRFTFCSAIYVYQDVNKKGWKRALPVILNPRESGSCITAQGISLPFSYRLAVDRAMVSGANGVGRWGADYWQQIFGLHGKPSYYAPGIGCVQILWPGPAGGQSSARFEAALEGVQETEARIFMEQAVEQGVLDRDLAERATKVLWDHTRSTLFIPQAVDLQKAVECVVDWQGDSRRIYRMAAEVAAKVQIDVERNVIEASVPARGRTPARIVVRNWTAQPRVCKIVAEAPWIVPEQAEVSIPPAGRRTVNLTLDTQSLSPNQKYSGNLVATDPASGLERTVKIQAAVGGIFDFPMPEAYDFLGAVGHAGACTSKRIDDQVVFNVPVGMDESKSFLLKNLMGSALSWKIDNPAPWLKVEPASGTLEPLEQINVKITSMPADTRAVTHETVLTIADTDSALTKKAKFITHVIPAYKTPEMPKGEAVKASTLPKNMIKSHKSRAYWFGSSDRGRSDFGPVFDKNGDIRIAGPMETTYTLEGSGFSAFSVKVQIDPALVKRIESDMWRQRMNFELHVDGQLRTQSGLVKSGDEPRLLVVEGLQSAKELRIVARFDTSDPLNVEGNKANTGIFWLEPTFYK